MLTNTRWYLTKQKAVYLRLYGKHRTCNILHVAHESIESNRLSTFGSGSWGSGFLEAVEKFDTLKCLKSAILSATSKKCVHLLISSEIKNKKKGRENTNQNPVDHTHDNLPPASLSVGNTSIYCPSRNLGDIWLPNYYLSSLHETGRNSTRYKNGCTIDWENHILEPYRSRRTDPLWELGPIFDDIHCLGQKCRGNGCRKTPIQTFSLKKKIFCCYHTLTLWACIFSPHFYTLLKTFKLTWNGYL